MQGAKRTKFVSCLTKYEKRVPRGYVPYRCTYDYGAYDAKQHARRLYERQWFRGIRDF